MTTTAAAATVPVRPSPARTAVLTAGGFMLVSFVIFAVLLVLDRPPAEPQLTLLGATDELHILAEGAGGGRVLIGGGSSGSELPALLGRQFAPFRRDLDLVIVADRRDLLGATELVRRGQVRAVVTIGLDDDRAATPALSALGELCAQRAVPLRTLTAPERISIGREGGLTIDLYPAIAEVASPRVRLAAGPFSASLVFGGDSAGPRVRGDCAAWLTGALSRGGCRLGTGIDRADPPAETQFERVLPVASGQRTTIALGGATVRLRGGNLATLDTARAAR